MVVLLSRILLFESLRQIYDRQQETVENLGNRLSVILNLESLAPESSASSSNAVVTERSNRSKRESEIETTGKVLAGDILAGVIGFFSLLVNTISIPLFKPIIY